MRLINVLSENDIREIRSLLDSSTEWVDGASTAYGSARARKKNLQITEGSAKLAPLFSQVRKLILKHAALKFSAFPRAVVNIRAAKYREGDTYGWHVDRATMDGHRSDISFTMFINPKDSYEGGELEFDFGTHRFKVRGDAGQILLYPTGVLHQVLPVTSGERLVIVGWIESMLPHAEDREQIQVLLTEATRLRDKYGAEENLDKLNRAIQHMIRRLST